MPSYKPTNRPLISMIMLCYKQERYIREAVEGALAQTYSPLEIILSDDASPDDTFRLIQQVAETYRGSHTIRLNRNEHNTGIGDHLNRAMSLAKGEWIVVAAGDDISRPDRVEKIFDVFSKDNSAMAIFSDLEEIDDQGQSKRILNTIPPANCDDPVECCQSMLRGITGASNSWSRKLFEAFGPMENGVTFEDRVIAFRASLLGRIRHIPEPLVRYRRHPDNTVTMFHAQELHQTIQTTTCFLMAYRAAAKDIETYLGKINPDDAHARACRGIIRRRIRKLNAYLTIYKGGILNTITGWLELLVARGNLAGALRATRTTANRSKYKGV